MSLTTAVKTCFRRYATFSGRAGRSEFWWFYLFSVLISLAFSILLIVLLFGSTTASGDGSIGTGGVLVSIVYLAYLLVSLALLVPSLAVMWRRLHDTDRSGLWWFIGLVPLIGGIVLIVFWAQDSTRGTNRFGPSPKDVGPRAGPVSGGHGTSPQGYGTSV